MRKFWSALAIVLVLLPIGGASAGTISISQEIHLRGVVPDMRFIVVNARGSIVEITSNTPHTVTPRVFLNSLQSGTELPLTPGLLKDYEQKIQGKDLHSTDLYFTPAKPEAAKTSTPSWLTAISRISLLKPFGHL